MSNKKKVKKVAAIRDPVVLDEATRLLAEKNLHLNASQVIDFALRQVILMNDGTFVREFVAGIQKNVNEHTARAVGAALAAAGVKHKLLVHEDRVDVQYLDQSSENLSILWNELAGVIPSNLGSAMVS